MKQVKIIVALIKGSSFMLLFTAVIVAFKRAKQWLLNLARPKETIKC
jgi:hypothetical protein